MNKMSANYPASANSETKSKIPEFMGCVASTVMSNSKERCRQCSRRRLRAVRCAAKTAVVALEGPFPGSVAWATRLHSSGRAVVSESGLKGKGDQHFRQPWGR